MKTLQDLRELSVEELVKEISVSERHLYEVGIKVRAQQEKQTHLVKAAKKYIARLNTVIKEKKIEELSLAT